MFQNQSHNLGLWILRVSEVNSDLHQLNESNEAFYCFGISLLLHHRVIAELESMEIITDMLYTH